MVKFQSCFFYCMHRCTVIPNWLNWEWISSWIIQRPLRYFSSRDNSIVWINKYSEPEMDLAFLPKVLSFSEKLKLFSMNILRELIFFKCLNDFSLADCMKNLASASYTCIYQNSSTKIMIYIQLCFKIWLTKFFIFHFPPFPVLILLFHVHSSICLPHLYPGIFLLCYFLQEKERNISV